MFSSSARMLFSPSCRPPPLPCPDTATADRVLLEPLAYIFDRTNATTAETFSCTGYPIRLTFCVAEQPGVSCVCIHCPGLKHTDFHERPRIIFSEKDLLLLWVTFKFGPYAELGLREYFVYKAGSGKPSLHLLPDPHPLVLRAWEVGLVPHGDQGHFVVAALCLTRNPWVYDLHLFSSMTWTWSTKVISADIWYKVNNRQQPGLAHKVISLGGGTLGWVDLWRGILVCNVFDEVSVVQFIQLPMLMLGNKNNSSICPWPIRDVTCNNGLIKFVEIETHTRQVDNMWDCDKDIVYDSDCLMKKKDVNWRIITWHKMVSSNYWRRDCMYYDKEISIEFVRNSMLHFESKHVKDGDEGLILENLFASYPVLSLNSHGDDIVYLMCKLKSNTEKKWLITVDLKMKTLIQLAPFSIKGYFSPAYPCQLSKYLNRASASTGAL